MKLLQIISNFKRWFYIRLESVILIAVLGTIAFPFLFQEFAFLYFNVDGVSNVLGNILQSLASIFAIVFSISLVAIQLCSENLSHRVIDLYVNHRNFIFPLSLNIVAIQQLGGLRFRLYQPTHTL